MARLILMGRIAAAHGLKGLVKIQSFTGEPAAIGRYGPLLDATGQRRFEVTVQNLVKGGVVARIAGVTDRTAAEKLRGIELYLPREALPPAAEGEYYHADLVGLAVALTDGSPFGVVRSVENFGAGDLLAIDRPGKGSVSLPFTDRVVPVVDLAAGRIVVDPPLGCWRMVRQTGRPEAAEARRRRSRREQGRGPGFEAPLWRVTVLSIFPEMFPGPLGHSLAGKALESGIWGLETVDIRGFASDKHRSVDDAPFGGGPGMVMKPEVVDQAIRAAHRGPEPVVFLTPRGRRLDQAMVRGYAARRSLTLLCGRFEGVDERVVELHGVEEVSLGDIVLSGGEPAAIALIDAVVRLLPGVVGAEEGLEDESFERGLLEYPHYTRPVEWLGRKVPEVLISGHHEKVKVWRQRQSEAVTRTCRPDLWQRHVAAGNRIEEGSES
jgi:tRNA (guanine37-N1)-methyltransferase